MAKWLMTGCLLVCVLAAPCRAGKHHPPPVTEADCAPRTVSVPKVYLVEEQCATTIPKLTLREEVVGRGCAGVQLEYAEEKHSVTEMTLKPRKVEQQVVCTEMRTVEKVDPCTGCVCTVREACPVVRTVTLTVYDPVPVTREVVVRVPCLKPGKEVVVKKMVLDVTAEAAIEKRYRLLTVPNEVPVPSCPPAPCVNSCPVP